MGPTSEGAPGTDAGTVQNPGFTFGFTGRTRYVKATTPGEVSSLLASDKDSMILAGGTDVLVEMRQGDVSPATLIDLKGVTQLAGIVIDGGYLRISPLATVNEIIESPLVMERFPILAEAGKCFGCHEIRNRATIGGNIAHASPGAELPGPLLVLGASVEIQSMEGTRRQHLHDFFKGPGKTMLAREKGEFISGILVPIPAARQIGRYRRYSRVKGMDLACASVSVLVDNPGDVSKRTVTVALGAMAPVPCIRKEAGEALSGKAWDAKVIARAGELLVEGLSPRKESLRGSPEYKKHIVKVFLEEMLASIEAEVAGGGKK